MSKLIKTPIDRFPEFKKLLDNSTDENAVRNAYRILMGYKEWEAPFNCDGYYSSILYEFKYQKKLTSKEGYKALAQACYYLRKFVVEGRTWPDKKGQYRLWNTPNKIVVGDKDEAFVVMTTDLEPYFMSNKYDWSRSASSPDETLIKDISVVKFIVFKIQDKSGCEAYLDALNAIGTTVLKVITRDNFDSIFQIWKDEFAPDLDPQRAALAFLLDLDKRGAVNLETGAVLFDFEGKTQNVKLRVPVGTYTAFWSVYKRPPHAKELSAIYERKDRIVAMQNRRMDGEFFTPLSYAELAHEYLMKSIPDNYDGQGDHHSMYDDYNWYDPCCGSGNLTYHCPAGMKGKLFMSTLNQEDVDVCQGSGQNPNAQIFAYDFLNQTDEELPNELRERLTPGSKWVFILNPPFAAGTSPDGKKSKSGVAETEEVKLMRENKMGHACQNTTSQFLHRINRLIDKYNIDIKIGLFSPAIFLTGGGYSEFRNKWFETVGFDFGFCFPSVEFSGVNGEWPILFTSYSISSVNKEVVTDVFQKGVKIGFKEFGSSETSLNKWIERPKANTIMPPLTNAITQCTEKSIYLDKLPLNAMGYVSSVANDIRNSNVSFILSSPAGHGHGWGITECNFDKSLLFNATKKFVVSTWLNNKDEYSVPNISHPDYEQFKNDAIIWALFNGSNQSSSLGDVEYKNNTYDIKNEFFYLTKEEFENIDTMPFSTINQASRSNERFVSQWLKDKTFSPDILELLELGKELIRVSAWARPHADTKYQLMRWDAGWYQIRMGLFGKDVKFAKTPEMIETMDKFTEKYKEITLRLRPYVYELGFLPKEIMFEEE